MDEALTGLVLALLLGAILGGIVVWLWRRAGEARMTVLLEDLRLKAAGAEADRLALSDLRARQQERAEAEREKAEALTRLRQEVEDRFKVLADEALKAQQARFLELAGQNFEAHRLTAASQVEGLVKPIGETLTQYKQWLDTMEQQRRTDTGALSQQIRGLVDLQEKVRSEAARLSQALRGTPKAAGRWGEETLRNVLELAGLSAHCDFQEQTSLGGASDRLRPDVLIRLPGGEFLAVDAKAPIQDYLAATEAVDEAERTARLDAFARAVRGHVNTLSRKDYTRHLPDGPDFVVMFVPGDNFLATAMDRDRALFDDAIAARILIATPTTLIALAKAVALGWRQERMVENAREVAQLGALLHERLVTFTGHLANVGDRLDKAVRAYNDAVSSLESRLLVTARRFTAELGVADGGKALPEVVRTIEERPRPPAEQVSGAAAGE